MRPIAWGVIAITSMLTFACTTTTTTETGGADPPSTKPSDPAPSWRSRLALSRAGTKASSLGAISRRLGTGAPAKLGGAHKLSGGGGAGSCGLTSGDPTCDTCLDTSCCAENTACVSNADCSALLACGDACTDETCISACMTAHPTGAALLDTLGTCVSNSCATACGGGGPPPPTSACGFGSGDVTCDTCLDTSCCGDANACLGDADCTALIDCVSRCSDAACESACEAAHPAGTTKLTTLATCANVTCGAACGGGGPGGGGPGSCGLTSGNATCDTCLDTSCCAQTTTCLGDADCVALINCYDACTDAVCASACDAAHSTGATKIDAVAVCAQNSCAATCGF